MADKISDGCKIDLIGEILSDYYEYSSNGADGFEHGRAVGTLDAIYCIINEGCGLIARD